MLLFVHRKRVLPATESPRFRIINEKSLTHLSREKLAAFSMAGFTKHITETKAPYA